MSSLNVHFLTYHINKDLMMAQRLFPLFLPLTSLCPIPKQYTFVVFFQIDVELCKWTISVSLQVENYLITFINTYLHKELNFSVKHWWEFIFKNGKKMVVFKRYWIPFTVLWSLSILDKIDTEICISKLLLKLPLI